MSVDISVDIYIYIYIYIYMRLLQLLVIERLMVTGNPASSWHSILLLWGAEGD